MKLSIILERIKAIESLYSKQKNKEALEAEELLCRKMRDAGYEDGNELIKKILGTNKINPAQAVDIAPNSVVLSGRLEAFTSYHKLCDEAFNRRYERLLPYAQLAYHFENNGIAEEHAFKLAMLFENEKEALDYLTKFSKQERSDQLMHDALLFSLPPHTCNFKKWRNLAKINLDNKDFKKLLANADVLEAEIKREQRSGARPDQHMIDTLKKELSNKRLEFKALNRKHGNLSDINKEKHTKLIAEISECRLKLAKAFAGTPWEKVNYEMLQAYDERRITEAQAAYGYFLKNGLTKQDFTKFSLLDRSEAGKNIPNISIKGADYGFPGFYLKKVNVQDDFEAARAACIGKLTDCCQSLSGEAGESCAIHGLTSPQGGFYMLLKGDPEDPKPEDEVWGAAWTWRSQEGNLVFDSIEMAPAYRRKKVTEEGLTGRKMAHTLFTVLADRTVNQDETVEAVYCGRGSGISSSFGYDIPSIAIQQKFSDYDGYSDASMQHLIAHKTHPYLVIEAMPEEKKIIFQNKIKAHFLKCIEGNNVEFLQGMIEFFIRIKDPAWMNSFEEINFDEKNAKTFEELRKYAELFSIQEAICNNNDFFQDEMKVFHDEMMGVNERDIEKSNQAFLGKMLEMVGPLAGENGPNHFQALKEYALLLSIGKMNVKNKIYFQDEMKLCFVKGLEEKNLGFLKKMIAAAVLSSDASWMQIISEIKPDENTSDVFRDIREYEVICGKFYDLCVGYSKSELLAEEVLRLVQAGLDPNIQTLQGDTPLTKMLEFNGKPEDINQILSIGALVNMKNVKGDTPLFFLLKQTKNISLARVLMEAGADFNMPDANGVTPLDYILENITPKEYLEWITLFVQAGADVDVNPALSGSMFHYFFESYHGKITDKMRIEIFTVLLQGNANINKKDSLGETPLMIALRKNTDKSVIDFLLNNGADVNEKNNKGESPLMLALEKEEYKSDKSMISLLSGENRKKNTGLHRDYRPSQASYDADKAGEEGESAPTSPRPNQSGHPPRA